MFNHRLRLDLVITLSPLDLYIAPLTSPRSCRQSVVCYHRHARWTHAFLNAATMQSLLWVAAYGILISLFFIHRLIWAYTYIVEEGTFFYLVRSRLHWLLLCTTTNDSIDNRSIMTNNWWLHAMYPPWTQNRPESAQKLFSIDAQMVQYFGECFLYNSNSIAICGWVKTA